MHRLSHDTIFKIYESWNEMRYEISFGKKRDIYSHEIQFILLPVFSESYETTLLGKAHGCGVITADVKEANNPLALKFSSLFILLPVFFRVVWNYTACNDTWKRSYHEGWKGGYPVAPMFSNLLIFFVSSFSQSYETMLPGIAEESNFFFI